MINQIARILITFVLFYLSRGPTTSAQNVIPMAKLKNGFFSALGFAAATVEKVKEKAVEINNSEQVQNLKQKTYETAAGYYAAAGPTLERARAASIPIYDKAVEVADPVWKKTCEVTTNTVQNVRPAAEKAYEVTTVTVQKCVETVQPAAEKVYENIVPVVEKGLESMKPVAEKVQVVIAAGAEKFANMTGLDQAGSKEPYAPSALDSATKGGLDG